MNELKLRQEGDLFVLFRSDHPEDILCFRQESSARRKRISLKLSAPSRVILYTPVNCKVTQYLEWIWSKKDWIAQVKVRLEKQVNTQKKCLTYLGQDVVIRWNASVNDLRLEGEGVFFDCIFSKDSARINIESVLTALYKKRAKSYLEKRVEHFAQMLGISKPIFRLSNAKTRWGSCTSSGKLSFSWRLMMIEPELIDHVVAHEFAHLKEMNHQQPFWDYLNKIDPQSEAHKTALKKISLRSFLI